MIVNIAWRNIWRNPTRSLVIMVSVAIGIWAGAFIASIYWGMGQERFKIAIENEIAHIQLHHPEFTKDFTQAPTITNANDVLARITQLQGVRASTIRTIVMGMLANATGSSGIQINGILPDNEASVSQLKSKLNEGDYFTSKKANGILIGAKLAKKLKLKLRSKVVLTFQDNEDNLVSSAFWVEGIYQSYNTSLDERNVYVKMSDIAGLLNLTNEAHEIAVLLQNDSWTETVKNQITAHNPLLKVQDWREISPDTALILSTMNQASMIFSVIILLALAFGIINTMLMAILERTKELGVLMALGMNRLKLYAMIMTETVFLVLSGAPVGFLLSFGIIKYLSVHGIDLTAVAGQSMGDFGFSNVIYPDLPFTQYIQILILVLITAVISAIFPIIRALRLNPVEAIRR
ncbi:MAG: ABC transporter permease [Sphingobacteriales bacterium]|nr:MAG: ABC transporter permease [Sphingobacteriales bacterium]